VVWRYDCKLSLSSIHVRPDGPLLSGGQLRCGLTVSRAESSSFAAFRLRSCCRPLPSCRSRLHGSAYWSPTRSRLGDSSTRLPTSSPGHPDSPQDTGDLICGWDREPVRVAPRFIEGRSLRVSSLVAHTDVRTITLSRPRFESVVRERPSVGLSVMRLLAERATEATRSHEETTEHHG
jgi:hypothetical protein